MALLLDLLYRYPILEKLASSLALGDLFNLSKVNSSYRAVLHGFGKPVFQEVMTQCKGNLRPGLCIGAHRTPLWENLKARSRLQCSEPQHKRGSHAKGCLICSMPVCEACIIKSSFTKRNDTTFQNRHRPLCSDCWYSGNRHKLHPIGIEDGKFPRSYPDQAANGELCVCTAKDGILCTGCRSVQNAKVNPEMEQCHGESCPNGNLESKPTYMQGRVCLWCSRQLPGSRDRAKSRRDYDARHLFARSHSTYDRLPEEENLATYEEQRILELDALSRRNQEIRDSIATPVSSHGIVPEEDSPEKRSRAEILIHAAEEDRWQASEATRRQEFPSSPRLPRTMSDLPRYEDHTTTRDVHDLRVIAANNATSTAED